MNGKYERIAQQLFCKTLTSNQLPIQVTQVRAFADGCIGIIFPQLAEHAPESVFEVDQQLTALAGNLESLLNSVTSEGDSSPTQIVDKFMEEFPKIQGELHQDAEALYSGDPAARSIDEVVLSYPGLLAVGMYRIANRLHRLGVTLIPRVVTEYAHQITGVDIHPAATIGSSFFIDHATGVVIGETSEIGNHVKIYQGVTLGALSVDKRFSRSKRHPTIEDHVVIYSNATILGGDTRIGHHTVIGGNVWITESVPPHSTVYHKSEISLRSAEPGK